MNSSILDIDSLLQDDSFMLLAEDELQDTANFYLKQWKERAEELEGNSNNGGPLNATVTIPPDGSGGESMAAISSHRFGMNPKLVDTRTFTRPKKQQQQQLQNRPFLNETMVMSSGGSQLSQSPKGSPGINLQIGGLVTMPGKGLPIAMTQSSMQKSLIGDTSPPSSICSSTIDLATERLASNGAGGLIAGPDFGNETYFHGNATTDKLAAAYDGYNMEDVKRDLEMLQNLTFDGLAMDMISERPTGAAREELENGEATVLITREIPVNKTFENGGKNGNAQANGTFDLIGEEGGTCGQTMIIGGEGEGAKDAEESENSTFNLTKLVKAETGDEEVAVQTTVLVEKLPPGVDLIVEEDDIHLEFGRNSDSFIQSTPICKDKAREQNDIFNFSPTGNDELYRTIEMNMKNNGFKVPQVPARFMDRAAAPVLPIATPVEKEVVDEKVVAVPASQLSRTMDLGPNKTIPENDEDQSSPEFEDLPELRSKGSVPVDMLRPEERQSLVNFEEYEKSLQLLDDNRNERDFDDMLASINTTDMRRSTEKMRQSLDSIKKRHSLINYERQQEELRRKVNDIDQEINNLTMESSGSGPRLLNRRSRLFDEQQQQLDNVMNRTMDLNTNNNGLSAAPVAQPQSQETVERRSVPEKRDRDRFKTIKIFRKTVNSNIPDADETSIDALEGNNETQLIDREQEEVEEEEVAPPPPPPVQRGLVRPSRMLARPKYASGLQRPSHLGITAQKASSADDLLDSRRGEQEINYDEHPMRREGNLPERGQSVQRTNPVRPSTAQGKLKSPMGIKSKSIHNLMVNGGSRIGGGAGGSGGGMGRMSVQSDMRPFSTNTFKVNRPSYSVASSGYGSGSFQKPVAAVPGKPSMGVNMRQTKSIGGVQRPVSAVLPQSSAVNVRRQEQQHSMADRYAAEEHGRYSPVDNPEPAVKMMEPRAVMGLAAPRASGLRPPSGIARPSAGVRSGLPRLSGIPRR